VFKRRLSAGDRTCSFFRCKGKKLAKRPSPKPQAGTVPRAFVVPYLCKVFCDDQAKQHRSERRGRRRHVGHGTDVMHANCRETNTAISSGRSFL
jgi:hypothetical protein